MKCPTCKRRFEQEETTNCRRCGTDLTLLIELERSYRLYLKRGFQKLSKTAYHEARDCFTKALAIHSDSKEATRGMALSGLLQGSYKDAMSWYFRNAANTIPIENSTKTP